MTAVSAGPTATERAILAKVEERTRSRRHADRAAFAVAIRNDAPDAWAAETEHALESGWTATVVPCRSVLGVLDAFAVWKPDPGAVLALVTDLSEGDLGDAILARLDSETLLDADRHTLLETVLGTRTVDARIRKTVWLIDALLDLAAEYRLRPQLGTTLTLRRALSLVATDRLGLDPESGDLADLVLALDRREVVARWRALTDPERVGLREYLCSLIGEPAGVLLDLARRRDEVLADLLVLQAVTAASTDRGAGADAHIAYGRATQSRFHADPPQRPLAVLADAAVLAVQRLDPAAAVGVLRRAEAMLDELAAPALTIHSPVLPRGHVERRAAAAADLSEATLAAVAAHAQHRAEPWRHARLLAALRLRRWLGGEPRATVDGVADGLRRHARELAWVDRALQEVEAGDADGRVRAVLRDVATAVADARAEIDIAFARRLAAARETPSETVAVETFLSRRVAPLVDAGQDVVLVIVDGMSGAVAGDLADALAGAGWTEMVAAADGGREAVLAALPTETQFSRSSLLRGRLVQGRQDREAAEFPSLSCWKGHDPRILHKASVAGDAGFDIGPELDAALDPQTGHRLVAVVLNAVDDSLPKGRASTDPTWRSRDVPGLDAVLARAQESGRAVILVSDHGHVLESGSVARPHAGGGARWRPADGAVEADEVRVEGPRVLTSSGTAVLAAVERLRYGNKAAGYHGGATLAEVAIPLVALVPPGVETLPGWRVRTAGAPSWWTGTAAAAPGAVPATPSRSVPKRKKPAQVEGLFDEPATTPALTPAPSPDSRGQELIGSSAFRDARAGATAAVPEPALFATVVDTVLAAGGKAPAEAVAAAAGRPAHRVRGLVAVMAQVLNRDSFPVLALVDNGRTVALDRALLDEQFPPGRTTR